MTSRTNTARWIESAKRWQINVQKNGKRKTFTCSTRAARASRKQTEKPMNGSAAWKQAHPQKFPRCGMNSQSSNCSLLKMSITKL